MRGRGLGVVILIFGVGFAALLALFPVTSGYGLLETPGVTTNVIDTLPTTPVGTKTPTTTTATTIPCPSNKPGSVIYFADNPEAASLHDFGTPLTSGLSPTYEPTSTPRPNTHTIVSVTWYRLCHDPVLTRAVVAAAAPEWTGLHGSFDWDAALKLLSSHGAWSTAQMKFYANAPTPWTMMMVVKPHGPPATFIVHAPYNGWYLVVHFSTHDLLLRVGCGDQPVLTQPGYQAPLFKLFPSA